jgi:hypothetical protein
MPGTVGVDPNHQEAEWVSPEAVSNYSSQLARIGAMTVVAVRAVVRAAHSPDCDRSVQVFAISLVDTQDLLHGAHGLVQPWAC